MASPMRVVLREAIVKRLRDDGDLSVLLGSSNRIFKRPNLKQVAAKSVTYFDFGRRPDATVPMLDRRFQFDCWDTDPVNVAKIAQRVEDLLDDKPFGSLPASGARVANMTHMQLVSDGDVVADDGDLLRVTLEFRVIAYRL